MVKCKLSKEPYIKVPGKPGLTGHNGPKGLPGLQGATGPDGAQGAPGVIGPPTNIQTADSFYMTFVTDEPILNTVPSSLYVPTRPYRVLASDTTGSIGNGSLFAVNTTSPSYFRLMTQGSFNLDYGFTVSMEVNGGLDVSPWENDDQIITFELGVYKVSDPAVSSNFIVDGVKVASFDNFMVANQPTVSKKQWIYAENWDPGYYVLGFVLKSIVGSNWPYGNATLKLNHVYVHGSVAL